MTTPTPTPNGMEEHITLDQLAALDPEVLALVTAQVKQAVIAEIRANPGMALEGLPASAFVHSDGQLYHRILRMTEGGSMVLSTRRLARTLEEAREKRSDYLHPTLGWIWDGYKLARDRTPQDIMDDKSIGGATPPGEKPVQELVGSGVFHDDSA